MKSCITCTYWDNGSYSNKNYGDCNLISELIKIHLSKIPTISNGNFYEEESDIEYIETRAEFFCSGWKEIDKT